MVKGQKIVSLLPGATEIVCLLGLEKSLSGISDDSDFPSRIKKLPVITTTTLDANLTSQQIDKQVKEAKHQGRSVFHINSLLLAKLAPDIIFTQELCPVCAPSSCDIEQITKRIGSQASLVSLAPHTIADIFENIKTIGQRTNTLQKAHEVIKTFESRLVSVTRQIKKKTHLPTVLVLEWLDPLMNAGHWVPDMVKQAGGRMVLSQTGARSRQIDWKEIITVDPDMLILAPCGFAINRTLLELSLITEKEGFKDLKAFKNKNIFFIDGNTYLTRPGPRIIDGVEIIAEILHPSLFPRKYGKKAWKKMKTEN